MSMIPFLLIVGNTESSGITLIPKLTNNNTSPFYATAAINELIELEHDHGRLFVNYYRTETGYETNSSASNFSTFSRASEVTKAAEMTSTSNSMCLTNKKNPMRPTWRDLTALTSIRIWTFFTPF